VLEVVRALLTVIFSLTNDGIHRSEESHCHVNMTNERERVSGMTGKGDFKADKMLVGWLGGWGAWGSFNISAINILSLWSVLIRNPGFRPFFRLFGAAVMLS